MRRVVFVSHQSPKSSCAKTLTPSSSLYVPGSQALQEWWRAGSVAGSGLYLPAEQTVQVMCWLGEVASSALKRPDGQVGQDVEEEDPE